MVVLCPQQPYFRRGLCKYRRPLLLLWTVNRPLITLLFNFLLGLMVLEDEHESQEDYCSCTDQGESQNHPNINYKV